MNIIPTLAGLAVKAKAIAVELALAVLVVALAFSFGLAVGSHHERVLLTATHQAEMASLRADLSDQVVKAEQHARDVERASVDNMAATTATYESRIHEQDAEVARIGDALHTGSIRLLDRFTCGRVVSSPGAAPGAASAVAGNDPVRGLQPDDAEFLVRFAARAQHALEQARALRDVAHADREVKP